MFKHNFFSIAMAALFMLSGCEDDKEAIAVTGVSLNHQTLSLAVGESSTLKATVAPDNATDPAVAWSISPTGVATVVDGRVTAEAEGTATITAATANGKKATCTVTVSPNVVAVTGITLLPATLNLSVGEDSTLTVTVTPEDATDPSVVWYSSNAAAATVDNGVVTAQAAGSTVITAATVNGLTAQCEVTVIALVTGITLNKQTLELAVGDSETLTATITPSDATDPSVSWSISPTGIATVENNGRVSAVAEGTATITVTSSNGLTDECELTVEAASLRRKVFALADLETGSTANDLMFSWGSSLVHRTAEGTLEVFDMTGAKTGTLLGDASAPWSDMREIMYCPNPTDGDVLMTISTADSDVGFWNLSGNQATLVNPGFGGGFSFKHFLPFTNVFYSIDAAGETKRWNFYPGATWNVEAYNVVINSGDQIYGPVCSWNNCAIIGVTADDGKLWYRTVTTAGHGTITGWFELGSGGWDRYVRIFGIGTSLLCLDAEGFFWLYEDFNTTGPWGI